MLQAATFAKLHGDPFEQRYSFGWGIRDNAQIGGKTLTHDGSNGMWYARIRLVRDRDIAILVVSNSATPGTTKAMTDVSKMLLAKFAS